MTEEDPTQLTDEQKDAMRTGGCADRDRTNSRRCTMSKLPLGKVDVRMEWDADADADAYGAGDGDSDIAEPPLPAEDDL
jgi:hypothetical protein